MESRSLKKQPKKKQPRKTYLRYANPDWYGTLISAKCCGLRRERDSLTTSRCRKCGKGYAYSEDLIV